MEHVNNIMSKADVERLKSDNYQPIIVTAGYPITSHAVGGGISVEKFAENIKGSLTLSIKKESNVKIKIKDVNIIVENKVVEVTFTDGDKQKSVCREPDVFSLEMAISICITKHVLGGSSLYNKAVRNGLKCYENKLKKAEAEEKEKERIEKRKAKLAAYKKRRAEKRKEEQIETQKEAYLRAMRDFNKELSEASCE